MSGETNTQNAPGTTDAKSTDPVTTDAKSTDPVTTDAKTSAPKAKKPRKSKVKPLAPDRIEVLGLVARKIDETGGQHFDDLAAELTQIRKLKVVNLGEDGRALPGKAIRVSMLGVTAKGKPDLRTALRNWANKVRRTIAQNVQVAA